MTFVAIGWREDIYHMACHLVALHSIGVNKHSIELPIMHTCFEKKSYSIPSVDLGEVKTCEVLC